MGTSQTDTTKLNQNSQPKIIIAADHRGRDLAELIVSDLKLKAYEVANLSPAQIDPEDDYPLIARAAVLELLKQSSQDDVAAKLILICGSGHGMCIAANRFKGIRAAVGFSLDSIQKAVQDDAINTLCLAADDFKLGNNTWKGFIKTFLNTKLKGDSKYSRRILELG